MKKILKSKCPYCGHMNQEQRKVDVYNIITCADCMHDYVVKILRGSSFDQLLISKLDWVVEQNRVSGMYNLPYKQQAAVKKAIKELEETGELDINEPCDCGSHIRHNNGGNYHQIYEIEKNGEGYFIKDDCTSELEPPATWESSTKEQVYQLIQNCADWL